jgi:transcriptional regulator with XRE-family HTH domain
MNKRRFRAEVKKELYLHNWSYKDLAEATGYTHGTIKMMMHTDTRLSHKAMQKIAEALSISMEGERNDN